MPRNRDKKSIVTACFTDEAGWLVIVFVSNGAGALFLEDLSLQTSRRQFNHIHAASLSIKNHPFAPFVCTVLPLLREEIDAGWAEFQVLHGDGWTEKVEIRIDGPSTAARSPTAFSEEALRQSIEHFREMGLPFARALAFGHAMAMAAPSAGQMVQVARPPNRDDDRRDDARGEVTGEEIAAVVAPYFDPTYYRATYPDLAAIGTGTSDSALLHHFCQIGWREGRNPSPAFDTLYYAAANPDVTGAGINPFWHYVVAGMAEGRRARPHDGHRRAILRSLPPVPTRREAAVPNAVTRLHRERLAEALAARSCIRPGAQRHGRRGVVLSVSHDCYIRSFGGTQIVISDEQERFNAQDYIYIHISPGLPVLSIDPEGPGADLLEVVVDGVNVGTSNHDDLAWALAKCFDGRALDRLFTVHCALGHRVEGLVALQRAVKSSRNWFWVHDFSSLCANHTLLRNDVSFCGAPPPDSTACAICIHGGERSRHLRSMERLFTEIRFHVLAPSTSALDLWRHGSWLPALSTDVLEHCRFVESGLRLSAGDGSGLGTPGKPVRIAFVGSPTFHKGWGLFEDLVDALRGSFSYRFHHFAAPGLHRGLPGVAEVAVTVTATDRHGMAESLAAHAIDLVLVPSVWPETFSFVTHEALAAGADVVALEASGNVAATVSRLGRGHVFRSESDLLEFFTSFAAVEHVRDRLRKGIPAGTLDHCGTTAALVERTEART